MSYNEYGFTSPEESSTPPIDMKDLQAGFGEAEKKEYPKTLSNNPLIAKVQGEIYSLCGIEVDTEKNPGTKRLAKWFLDGSIFSKAELIALIGNLNQEEIKKVALYIMNNIGSILKEIALSIPNGLKWLLSKNTYDAGISISELIPTNKFVSLACAPVGIAIKKAAPSIHVDLTGTGIRWIKDIDAREAHLWDIMKKPLSANIEQIRKDILAGVINKNHWDIEARICAIFEMSPRERDIYIREGATRISRITDPSEKQKAIEAFEPWKKLALKFTGLENQRHTVSHWVTRAWENTVETGIRRQL